MARPLRIDYPNAWHHVMNRARRGAELFLDKADYQQFIELLQNSRNTIFSFKFYSILLDQTGRPAAGLNPEP
jgi:hypothetical protein